MSKSVMRLFNQFHPGHYDLTIRLDEAHMRFSGHVTITGKKVGRPSQRLTFHANGVKVTSGKITFRDKKGERELEIQRINHHKSFQEVRLHTESMVYPGDYVVEMAFEAPITDGMTGVYPCYFRDSDVEKKLFATQFESHHAREAFPCIDEPEAKATFALTLETETGAQVLGNMPVKSRQETGNGRSETVFATTPRMSTYLLAFVAGDIHQKSTQTKSGVDVNVWATSAQPAEALDFALDAAKRSVEYFEDYFGVPYPLPKIDHIALPDFSSGAMENWGLVTYRERVMLDYTDETSQGTREYIALVIAHETSHQWFGNLVTMRWWDDLWLNESFANMMEYQAVDAMFPEWHVWHSFIANEGLAAFRRDAIDGVQSVHVDVHHPDEISTLFDGSIVYAKGGRLLYMMKNYIGETAFRKGLSTYFKKHAYGNTSGDDLWAALSEASGKDVGAFMTPWLTRSGFPVVHVEQAGTHVTLRQEHFLDDPAKADTSRLWPVPVFANEVKFPEVFESSEVQYELTGSDPLLINTEARGHYLVNYVSAETKQHVLAQIKNQKLSEPDRLMLLNGSAMLARAGYHHYDEVLELLAAYENEASEPVWDIIGLVASEIRRFIDVDSSLEKPIKALAKQLAQKQHARLGWEARADESAADTKLRGLVIGLGIYGEDPGVLQTAHEAYARYLKNPPSLSPELRALVMSVLVREGDKAAIAYLLKTHDSSQNSELRADICDALTSTKDPKLASQLLERLKDGRLIKPQDVDRWLAYLLRNRYTREVAWQWMVDEWAWLQKTFENDKSYDYLPRYAAGAVNTREYEQHYRELFEPKLDQPMLRRNITIGFEEISNRLAWLERDLSAIQKFFKQ